MEGPGHRRNNPCCGHPADVIVWTAGKFTKVAEKAGVGVPADNRRTAKDALDALLELSRILTPGVERFEYFRQLQRIASGQAPLASILQAQDLYDNHFDDSPVWQQALTARL
jgi:hypothetical protein